MVQTNTYAVYENMNDNIHEFEIIKSFNTYIDNVKNIPYNKIFTEKKERELYIIEEKKLKENLIKYNYNVDIRIFLKIHEFECWNDQYCNNIRDKLRLILYWYFDNQINIGTNILRYSLSNNNYFFTKYQNENNDSLYIDKLNINTSEKENLINVIKILNNDVFFTKLKLRYWFNGSYNVNTDFYPLDSTFFKENVLWYYDSYKGIFINLKTGDFNKLEQVINSEYIHYLDKLNRKEKYSYNGFDTEIFDYVSWLYYYNNYSYFKSLNNKQRLTYIEEYKQWFYFYDSVRNWWINTLVWYHLMKKHPLFIYDLFEILNNWTLKGIKIPQEVDKALSIWDWYTDKKTNNIKNIKITQVVIGYLISYYNNHKIIDNSIFFEKEFNSYLMWNIREIFNP